MNYCKYDIRFLSQAKHFIIFKYIGTSNSNLFQKRILHFDVYMYRVSLKYIFHIFIRFFVPCYDGHYRWQIIVALLRNLTCAIVSCIISRISLRLVSESRFLLIVSRHTHTHTYSKTRVLYERGRASFLSGLRIIGFVFFGVL